ncbi:MAG: RNA polymerase factor sigma-54 [Candidatus Accumulibacter sp.]|jgi:RNA polymerase sigma-54 factor|nr:RNA polymerase factor sigma-54 [Accumulibacter sp.]
MKPLLQLNLSQRLALTPQLQQSIRLLQLSTVELEQEVERYLQENPLLQRAEEEDYAARPSPSADGAPASGDASPENGADTDIPLASADDVWTGDELPTPVASPGTPDDDDNDDFQNVQATTTSLREHLSWQLGMMSLPDRDRALIQCLIDALDENGYLTASLDDLVETLPRALRVEPRELQIALKHLQHFDPLGVGARSPRECLVLQLEALPPDETRELALQIVEDHLYLLANRDFSKLKKRIDCDDEDLRKAHLLIQSLNPHPGAEYAVLNTRYIIPDIVVHKLRGQWTASVNSEAYPRLRVNTLYARILARHRGSTLAGHLQEARWLVKNIQQRFETILKVAQSIVAAQRQFFDYGEIAMRPMVLRQISDALDMHESTVSRVTTQKYMATPRGIFEMKYFFGSHVATEAGGACSATAIRALMRQLVAEEDPETPLSDMRISEILGRQGIVVARRTVAKYREALNIPPVKFRKNL